MNTITINQNISTFSKAMSIEDYVSDYERWSEGKKPPTDANICEYFQNSDEDNSKDETLKEEVLKALKGKYPIKSETTFDIEGEKDIKYWNLYKSILKSNFKTNSLDSLSDEDQSKFFSELQKSITTDSIRPTIPEDMFMRRKKYSNMVVLNNKGQMLTLLRSDNSDYPNTFSLPGGKVEDGEDFEMAAKRELEEETGIVCKSCKYKGYKQHDEESVSAYYETAIDDSSVKLSGEHSDYTWSSKNMRKIIPMLKDTSKILDEFGY